MLLTWLMMKILGIFLLNLLWLRNTTMTVKFVMIPTEATELWMIRILSSLALSLLELFAVKDIVAEDTTVGVLLSGNSFEFVAKSIIKLKLMLELRKVGDTVANTDIQYTKKSFLWKETAWVLAQVKYFNDARHNYSHPVETCSDSD